MAKDKPIVTRVGQALQTIKFAPQHKEDLRRLEKVFGFAVVVEDAQKWYQETGNPSVGDYLEVVETRLRSQIKDEGRATAVEETLENPAILTISSEVFTIADQTPNSGDVKKLLEGYSADDILSAFKIYTSNLNEYEMKFAIKNFFRDGGAHAVISSLQAKKKSQVFREQRENDITAKILAESAEKQKDIKQELEEQDAATKRIADNPDAFFGPEI